jgi:hypothetical protein
MEKKALPSTKERLASVVQGFDSFDSEMKIGTRVSTSTLAHSSDAMDLTDY